MQKKVILSLVVGLVIAAGAVVAALVFVRSESANVKRGKELLSIDEVSGALTEFKIATKQDPSDRVAKALLLYTVLKEDHSLNAILGLQPAVALAAGADWPEGVAQDSRDTLDKAVKKLRQALYDKGVDTKDAADLSQALIDVAQYVFDNVKADDELDPAAFVLGMRGDHKAIAHLCDRLKSEKSEQVPDLLVRIGEPAAGPLQAAARDKENLGRSKALSVLARVLAARQAAEMFKENSHLRGLSVEDLPTAVRTAAVRTQLGDEFMPELTREYALKGVRIGQTNKRMCLHSMWASGDDQWENGLLVLEGFDTARSQVVSRFFLFSGAEGYAPAALVKGGRPVDNLGAVVRVRMTSSGRLEIARPEEVTVDEERQVSKSSFSRGDRVSIRNVASFGTVIGTDEYGLINVKLDHDVSGTSELQTQASYLRGLTTVKVQKPGFTLLNMIALLDGQG